MAQRCIAGRMVARCRLGPGPAVTGHAEIRDSWAAFPPLSAIDAEMVEIEGVGDLAYVRGTYHLVMDVEGSPEDTGKFLEIRTVRPTEPG